MNLRVILIMWMVAIALLLIYHSFVFYRSHVWTYKAASEKQLLMAAFSGLLLEHASISPFLNDRIIKYRRNL